MCGRRGADVLFLCERVMVVVKSSTGPPSEEEWRTGYGAVSKTTKKEQFNTHGITGSVIIHSYQSLAAFGVEI